MHLSNLSLFGIQKKKEISSLRYFVYALVSSFVTQKRESNGNEIAGDFSLQKYENDAFDTAFETAKLSCPVRFYSCVQVLANHSTCYHVYCMSREIVYNKYK